jgi:hypothetical protein
MMSFMIRFFWFFARSAPPRPAGFACGFHSIAGAASVE